MTYLCIRCREVEGEGSEGMVGEEGRRLRATLLGPLSLRGEWVGRRGVNGGGGRGARHWRAVGGRPSCDQGGVFQLHLPGGGGLGGLGSGPSGKRDLAGDDLSRQPGVDHAPDALVGTGMY